MSGPGHNGGPALEPGGTWRRTCWQKARADLLPTLPLEVVRLRVRRAAEIGLDYRSYATIRATTGHDLVAFLFSSNALMLFREAQTLDPARRDKLAAQRGVARHLAAQPPLSADRLVANLAAQGVAIDHAGRAPGLLSFADLRRAVRSLVAPHAPDRVLLVAETAVEREWVAAAQLAGHLPSARFFPAA